MSEFSTLLSKHIHSKDIKTSAMAQFCNLDRSTMYKLINGKRNPTSIEVVEKISDFMHLSPSEDHDLKEAYEITLAGYDNYYRRKDVMNFLKNFRSTTPPVSNMQMPLIEISNMDSTPLTGNSAISLAIFSILTTEATRENGHIKLLMRPDFEYVMNLLHTIAQKNPQLLVQHIIRLNNTDKVTASKTNYNLHCLSHVLPLYLCDCKYHAYYYYGNIHSDLDTFTLFPYLILTAQHAIMLSEDGQNAILYHDPKMISFLDNMYESYRNDTKPLLTKITEPISTIESLHKTAFQNKPSSEPEYSYQPTPCMTFILTDALLEKYISKQLPNRAAFIEYLSKFIKLQYESLTYRPKTFIFSEDGIERFLRTGIVDEYPEEFYTPFEFKDRVYLVKRFLEIRKTSQLRMLRHSIVKAEIGLTIFLYLHSGCFTLSTANHETIMMDITESSLVYAFRDFFENLNDEMFYSETEMIERLNALIERVKYDKNY